MDRGTFAQLVPIVYMSIYIVISFRKEIVISLPNFLSAPARVVGIPVVRAIFCFDCVIPNALFQEKESPGILVFVPFVAMILLSYSRSVSAFM